jgi:hypothetical protein
VRLLAAGTLLALAACNPATVKPAAPTADTAPKAAMADLKMLGERAVKRWTNIIGGEFDAAYDVLSPGYRQTHERKEYADIMRNRPVRWTNAKFLDQSCDSPEVCSVKIMIEFTISMPGVGTVPSQDVLLEKWIKSGDAWYFLPDNAAVRTIGK